MKKTINGKRYKKVTPEGGWGYIIAMGLSVPIICVLGTIPSFGLLFGDFLSNLGEGTGTLSLISACFFVSLSFCGLFTHFLFSKFAARSVGVMGAAIFTCGSFGVIFSSSVRDLIIFYGLLQGSGTGLMFPVLFATFNQYFIVRRSFINAVTQSAVGAFIMFYPVLVESLMNRYGFRGCLAVIAAINSNTLLATLVMHPVKWHMKRVEVFDEEMISLKSETNSHQSIEPKKKNSYESISTEENDEEIEVDMEKESRNNERRFSNASIRSLKQEQELMRRASSIGSLGPWANDIPMRIIDENEVVTRKSKNRGVWKRFVDFLDLTLLLDPVYVNIVIGTSFVLYSDLAFFTIEPMYLFSLGFTQDEVTFVIFIGAAADLSSRICLALSSVWFQTKARHIMLAGAVFGIIVRFAFLMADKLYEIALATACIGFLRTWLHVPLSLVYADHLPPERFPSGYGLFMFLQGNILFICAPIFGRIRDITGSYTIFFHCLTFCMAVCAVPWMIEELVRNWRQNRAGSAKS